MKNKIITFFIGMEKEFVVVEDGGGYYGDRDSQYEQYDPKMFYLDFNEIHGFFYDGDYYDDSNSNKEELNPWNFNGDSEWFEISWGLTVWDFLASAETAREFEIIAIMQANTEGLLRIPVIPDTRHQNKLRLFSKTCITLTTIL